MPQPLPSAAPVRAAFATTQRPSHDTQPEVTAHLLQSVIDAQRSRRRGSTRGPASVGTPTSAPMPASSAGPASGMPASGISQPPAERSMSCR
jgi:hypothetical protein